MAADSSLCFVVTFLAHGTDQARVEKRQRAPHSMTRSVRSAAEEDRQPQGIALCTSASWETAESRSQR